MSRSSQAENVTERGSILLVAADATLRTIVNLHLSPGGLEVVEAPDGEAAVEALRSRRVAVVVARAVAPRLEPAAFLARLRQSDDVRLSGVPVVLVAPARSARLTELCRRLPHCRPLVPPITGPRLAAALAALLAG